MTVEHVAGIAVRNPQTVAFARHYGVTSADLCEPADPATKGGSESTVKLAKADLVPTDTNLLGGYGSFAELEQACEVFCEQVNARVHRVTRRRRSRCSLRSSPGCTGCRPPRTPSRSG